MNVIEQVAPSEFPPSVESYFRSKGRRFCTAAGQSSMVAARAAQGWYPVMASEVGDPNVLRDLKKFCGARISREDYIDLSGAILYECTDGAFLAGYQRTAILDQAQEGRPIRSLEERDNDLRRETGGKVRFDLEMSRDLGPLSAHALGGAGSADGIRTLAKADLGMKEDD